MDVFECIIKRRSVRRYRSDPVPEEMLTKLLNVLRAAPSAANKQPFKFIVVRNPELRRRMVEECHGQKFFREAPVAIIACGDPTLAWKGLGGDKEHDTVDIDTAIAIDHLTLAAMSLGLGTCWVGAFQEPLMKNLFNVSEHIRIVTMTPLGYPAKPDAFRSFPEDKRKSLSELICHDVYS